MAGLVAVDGSRESVEREWLGELATALGVDASARDRIIDIAERVMAAQREAVELVAEA